MNITIETTYRNTRKFVSTQSIVAVCAIGLAIAAVSAGAYEAVRSDGGSARVAPPVPAFTSHDTPQTVFYIVNTQQDADLMQSAIAESVMAILASGGQTAPMGEIHFLVADTDEQKRIIEMVVTDINLNQMDGSTGVQVVDLR